MSTSITIGNVKETLLLFLKEHSFSRVLVLIDENTEKHCLPIVTECIDDFDIIKINSGEENKNLITCQNIWQSLTTNGFDVHGLLINLGGGVIGDMGGFCASTYKRGLSFINIPTTLLAMVDASVGGKLGIDFGPYKNHIGLFQVPEHVFIDPVFLETLSERELKSGFAEVIKHALITNGNDWNIITNSDFDTINWSDIIRKSVNIKSEIVTKDFKETGLRKTLNFGHTIGHAIESYFLELGDKQKILHGEAVAIGMICESYLSKDKLKLPADDFTQIVEFISTIYDPIEIPEGAFSRIAELCGQDKKNAGNKIQAVLLKSMGTAVPNSEITSKDIDDALRYYSTLNI